MTGENHDIQGDVPLQLHDHGARIASLRDRMIAEEYESLLITNLVNLRYITGFTGSAGVALVTQERLCLITDGRYDEQSRVEFASAGVEGEILISGSEGLEPELKKLVAQAGLSSVALEATDVSWQLQIDIAKWIPDCELRPAADIVGELRMLKSPSEIARMEAAAELGDAAYSYILERIEAGRTEIEIARELERYMIDNGAESLSFDAIVAAGPHSAMPHARPRQSPLAANDVILMDFGCKVDGYCSDMSRTVFLGTPPDELDHVYEIVLRAQVTGLASLIEDRPCSEVDALCRDSIAGAGYGEQFTHSTGHGVGLEIHEEPRLSQEGTAILAAGHVVTVEPGIYLTGIGGVRIEDMVLVTADEPLVLTSSPKELIVL